MIHKSEYYAQLTWFDRWQSTSVQLFRKWTKQWRAELWSRVFYVFSVLCFLSLAIIVTDFAMAAGGSMLTMTAVQSAANTIAVAMALGGGVHFQRLARQAAALQPEESDRSQTSKACTPAELQLFFMETHKAGISVTVARRLLAAGISSIKALTMTEDYDLLEIKGISPVTVHLLRQRFVSLS